MLERYTGLIIRSDLIIDVVLHCYRLGYIILIANKLNNKVWDIE